jgi:hypothetical protein
VRLLAPRAATLVSCLVAVAAAPTASAREAPPEIAAINVYVEMIPTSGGAVALGSATPTTTSSGEPESDARDLPLSSAAATKLRTTGGADAPLLERVATDAALGAPQRLERDGLDVPSETSLTKFLTEGESRGAWLFAALVLSTVAVAVLMRSDRRAATERAPRRRARTRRTR